MRAPCLYSFVGFVFVCVFALCVRAACLYSFVGFVFVCVFALCVLVHPYMLSEERGHAWNGERKREREEKEEENG